MNLQCKELSIYKIFNNHSLIEIPPYQRGFAWKKEQVKQFTDDIGTLLDERKNRRENHHFFGGIVSILTDDRIDIIDGQQRLTTFVLLVSQIVDCINKLIDEQNSKLSKKDEEALRRFSYALTSDYIYYQDPYNADLLERVKLKPTNKDANFYEQLLKEGVKPNQKGQPESHANLSNACRILRTFVKDNIMNEDSPEKVLENLRFMRDIFVKSCMFIFISTTDRSDAYRYFQVLNDRGVQLTTGDLLKADTLKALDERGSAGQAGEVAKLWDSVLTKNSSEIEGTLQTYYASVTGKRPSKIGLAKQYLDDIVRVKDLEDNESRLGIELERKVKEIVKGVVVIRKLRDAKWSPENYNVTLWEQERLRSLVLRLKQKMVLPLLLALSSLPDPKEFYKAVTVLERFIFRYITIGQRRANRMEAVFLETIKEIRGIENAQQYSLENFRSRLAILCENEIKDSLFKEMLGDYKYKKSSIDGMRVFFTGLENYGRWYQRGAKGEPECKDVVSAIDSGELTLEHVYPQIAKKNEKNEQLELVKHDIGNLTILGPHENSVASNKKFAEKKIMFERSNILLNRMIAAKTQWSLEVVKSRQDELIDMAVKVFVP